MSVIVTVWNDIKQSTIQKSSNISGFKDPKSSVTDKENEKSIPELVMLANELPVPIINSDIQEWCIEDVQMELTYQLIADMATNTQPRTKSTR